MMDNTQQSDFWNGDAGERWVKFSDRLDAMLLPFAHQVLATADIQPDETVLDIGCGGGALSLMAAHQCKSVLGVDISQPLVNLAKERAKSIASARFQHGDAATIDLEEERDVMVSRFGVMFFSDPVGAFANLLKQVKPDGRMVFVCWQSPIKNLWAKAPLDAALPFLKEPPSPPEPFAPGPFALADPHYIEGILEAAGWGSVDIKDWTGEIRLPGENTRESAAFMMEMGPLSRILKEQNLEFDKVQNALVDRLAQNANSEGAINMQASVWIVSAKRPS